MMWSGWRWNLHTEECFYCRDYMRSIYCCLVFRTSVFEGYRLSTRGSINGSRKNVVCVTWILLVLVIISRKHRVHEENAELNVLT